MGKPLLGDEDHFQPIFNRKEDAKGRVSSTIGTVTCSMTRSFISLDFNSATLPMNWNAQLFCTMGSFTVEEATEVSPLQQSAWDFTLTRDAIQR